MQRLQSARAAHSASAFTHRPPITGTRTVGAHRIDLYLHRQGLDTSTPTGKMMFQMLGVFSEFERAMIVDRVKAGMRRAKAQGKAIGRPMVGWEIEERIRGELALGKGIHRSRARWAWGRARSSG